MYMYVYVCICVCVCVCVCICIYMYIYIYINLEYYYLYFFIKCFKLFNILNKRSVEKNLCAVEHGGFQYHTCDSQ